MGTNEKAATPNVVYDAERERFEVTLANGTTFSVPIATLGSDVEALGPVERSAVRLSAKGRGLRFDALDLDLYWPYFAAVLFGNAAWPTVAAQTLGRIRSRAKARASRANGAKGGRPRKSRVA